MLTDEPEHVLIAEMIREAALEGVRDELPHSIAVLVEEIIPEDGLTKIYADIYVERQSQKAIVIGAKALAAQGGRHDLPRTDRRSARDEGLPRPSCPGRQGLAARSKAAAQTRLLSVMRRPLYRDDALVLRVQRLGEADRIITLLTRRHGRVRAVAKGVRKISSRFGGRLEPFGYVDVQCSEGSSLDSVVQVEGKELFGRHFLEDYPRYTARQRHRRDRRAADPGRAGTVAAALPADPRRAAGALRNASGPSPWCSTPTCCGPWHTPAGHRPCATARSAPSRARTARSPSRPAASVCPNCRPPGAAHPHPATLDLMYALLEGRLGGGRRVRCEDSE